MSMMCNEMKENQRKLEIEYSMNSNATCTKIAQKYGADKGEFRDDFPNNLGKYILGKWVKIIPKSNPNPPADSVSQTILEIEKMGYKVEPAWFVRKWEVYKVDSETKKDIRIASFYLTRNGTVDVSIELSGTFEFRIDKIDKTQILDPIAHLYGLNPAAVQQNIATQ